MQNQNYRTHRQFVPMYHFVLSSIILACLIASVWIFYQAFFIYHGGRLIALVLGGLSVASLLFFWYGRAFALKAQDRAIRAEESLRHFALTGKLLDNCLTPSQITALRFASDTEFLILAERAAKENLTAEEIKKAIVNWKGDYYRA
jgi:hypothetical protein